MAALRELRKRLKSVRATGQLAGAMRTVAAAKFSRGEGVPAPELSGNPPSGDSVKPRREKPRFYRARN